MFKRLLRAILMIPTIVMIAILTLIALSTFPIAWILYGYRINDYVIKCGEIEWLERLFDFVFKGKST